MNSIRKRTSIHEKTVQQVAENAKEMETSRRRMMSPGRPRNSRLRVRRWSDGVDERVVAEVEKLIEKHKIDQRRIKKVSSTEVIIEN